MEPHSIYLFLIFIFLITMLGGWMPTVKIWPRDAFQMVISFCAGILLGAVFFHMLPEISPVLGKKFGLPVIIGFMLIFILEKFLMVHPCEEGECDYHTIGIAAYVGISFHSILDGVAIGAGSVMNLSSAIVLAVAIHKFPAALALSSILVKGGEFSRKKILGSMFLFSLTTPLGALLSMYILKNLGDYAVGMAVGVSAGTFLYIAVGDLLPAVHEEHEKKYKYLVSLFLGILTMIFSQDLI